MKNRKPVHLEYKGNLEMNMPFWAMEHVDALFKDPEFPDDKDWTHSGLAYAMAERMGVNDLEELVYSLQEEIKRRKE